MTDDDYSSRRYYDPSHPLYVSSAAEEVARNMRLKEREAAGLQRVVSLRQAGPAAHTVLVKDTEGERLVSTLRGGDERPRLGSGQE